MLTANLKVPRRRENSSATDLISDYYDSIAVLIVFGIDCSGAQDTQRIFP